MAERERCDNCGESVGKDVEPGSKYCALCEVYIEEQRRELDRETALGLGNQLGTRMPVWEGD